MIAYHGTKTLSRVMEEGLVPRVYDWGCRIGHICLADRPEVAAEFAFGPDSAVLIVDLDGLDLPTEGFVGGEMRVHEVIRPERLSVLREAVTPSLAAHRDPAYAYPEGQHPTCVRMLRERGLWGIPRE